MEGMTASDDDRSLAFAATDALDGARLIGYNSRGEVCVWFGGYSFNVYDTRREWTETRHFTSGVLCGMTDRNGDKGREMAIERMRSEGFEPVN